MLSFDTCRTFSVLNVNFVDLTCIMLSLYLYLLCASEKQSPIGALRSLKWRFMRAFDNHDVDYVCRRTSGPTRRSTKGQWTPEEVHAIFFHLIISSMYSLRFSGSMCNQRVIYFFQFKIVGPIDKDKYQF